MTFRVRNLWMWVIATGLIALLSGCNFMQSNRSPEEQFHISLSELAGIEKLTFTGESALRRNEQQWFEQHFIYDGQLTNHDMLSMQTRIPLQSALTNTKKEIQELKKLNPITVDLRRVNEGWVHTSSVDNQVDQALIRFNPLSQLESIVELNKNIQEEISAPRGTRVLRIELNSEDALEWLARQLSSEMKGLRTELNTQNTSYTPKVRSELDRIWKQGDEQLQSMLKQAKVGTVYHLTIDRKSNLPMRLTSESKLFYIDLEGNKQNETVVNDVVFQH
jgi:hypothetical protein